MFNDPCLRSHPSGGACPPGPAADCCHCCQLHLFPSASSCSDNLQATGSKYDFTPQPVLRMVPTIRPDTLFGLTR